MNRDEDLLLFTNMYKREKNDLASLLLPIPDEFEANGSMILLFILQFLRHGFMKKYEFI